MNKLVLQGARELKERDMSAEFRRMKEKPFSDLETDGFISRSPRLKEAGRYANTLGIAETAPHGRMNISLLEHGGYSPEDLDGAGWRWNNIIYWLDEGNPYKVASIGLQIEEELTPQGWGRNIEIRAFDNDRKEIELDRAGKERYLQIVLDDFQESYPDPEGTEGMRQSTARYGTETAYIRDMKREQPLLE